MKIGILTHPLDHNYGCLFQAFALQKTLRKMGYDVITINRHASQLSTIVRIKKFVKSLLKGVKNPYHLKSKKHPSNEDLSILDSKTNLFVQRNIKNTGIVYTKELKEVDRTFLFDAYVVGSDQVWLPHFCPSSFLDFVKRDGVKRIFYAASSGNTSFADQKCLARKCKKLSQKFCGISVREDTLIPVAKDVLGRDAIQVLDPTLLLDAQDYIDACVEQESEEPVIFTYILDKTKDKQELVDRVQSELKLPVIKASVEKDYKKGVGMNINDCIYPSVDHWILNMKRAQFVVTDSFHGTCMSIIFRKPFVVIGNSQRGLNRFISILKMFGLEKRLITCADDFKESFYNHLDAELIESIIREKRVDSIKFLTDNLK